MATTAWRVLGCGRSVQEWALRQGWGVRPVRQDQVQAQEMLVAALGLLAGHYGAGFRHAIRAPESGCRQVTAGSGDAFTNCLAPAKRSG